MKTDTLNRTKGAWRPVIFLLVASLLVAGAAASTNFRLDEETTPAGSGASFSANYHLAAVLHESPSGPEAVSTNFRLNTDLIPDTFEPVDTTPPVITAGPVVLYVGHDRALIEWETDELADGFVEYGLTPAYGVTVPQSTGFSLLHQVMLTGLLADTQYHFRVLSTDPYLNGPTFSADDTFTTLVSPDGVPPDVSAPAVTFEAVSAARIDFTTDKASIATIEHGPTPALGLVELDGAFRLAHSRLLSGLVPGSIHYFQISAEDAMGNLAVGALMDFQLPQAVSIETVSLPSARRGQLYDRQLSAQGGVGALSWTLVSGELPDGISLISNSGQLSGTPTETGTFEFTVRATDAGNPASEAEATLALRVNPPARKKDDGCSVGEGPLPLALLLLIALTGCRLIRGRRLRS
jgi:hypothetical protein